GGSAERLVHAGDDLETDVMGAQRAGLRAVWVNRRALPLPAGVRPDAELVSLDGLSEAVQRLLAA
ncbi:MAG TPA: HAD hydrolase-like protein, partial [Gaiellales bacterium]|nr:HAD hydrolase-like protein [Gaiellales bacterium]